MIGPLSSCLPDNFLIVVILILILIVIVFLSIIAVIAIGAYITFYLILLRSSLCGIERRCPSWSKAVDSLSVANTLLFQVNFYIWTMLSLILGWGTVHCIIPHLCWPAT